MNMKPHTEIGLGWDGISLSLDWIADDEAQEPALDFLKWANTPIELS